MEFAPFAPIARKYIVPVVLAASVGLMTGCDGDNSPKHHKIIQCPGYTVLVGDECLATTPDPIVATPQSLY